jgi:hypothetical protein
MQGGAAAAQNGSGGQGGDKGQKRASGASAADAIVIDGSPLKKGENGMRGCSNCGARPVGGRDAYAGGARRRAALRSNFTASRPSSA